MEGFNSICLRVATQNSLLQGFKVRNLSGVDMQICHLLYADDTVIFCEAKEEQIRIVRMILVVFEAVSGLVNWRKSCIYPIKEVIQIQALANVLGYRIENSQLFT